MNRTSFALILISLLSAGCDLLSPPPPPTVTVDVTPTPPPVEEPEVIEAEIIDEAAADTDLAVMPDEAAAPTPVVPTHTEPVQTVTTTSNRSTKGDPATTTTTTTTTTTGNRGVKVAPGGTPAPAGNRGTTPSTTTTAPTKTTGGNR